MSSSVVRHLVVACGWLLCTLATSAQDPSQFLSLTLSNGQAVINFTPHSAAQSYHLLSTPDLSQPAVTNGSAALNGFTLTAPMAPNSQFYFLKSVPVSSNAILSALLLNRLAYGPTPDELDRLAVIGPQAYIDEQTVPGSITEDVNNTHTNLPLIEAKLLAPTALLQILTLSNTVVVITNAPGDYSVTTTATIFTNNGTAISVLSAISTNYSTNVSPAAVTNISTQNGNAANISDLRARHVLRAVGARRQLLEVLLQFLENHFVTQYSKSVAYLNNFYNDGNVREDRYAVQWENQENERWRNALLNPNVTFYDLLKISVESPAMIVYLDTVTSRSDGSRVANENFARELLELFTFGVDNGYDQNDITIMSRSWAGWTIRYVHPDDAFNPFATNSTLRVVNASPTGTTKTNFVGVWALAFDGAFANTTNKFGPIFPGKTIPDRFGPPWAGNSYELQITTNRNTAAERMQKGYDIVNHLANQPFTMEYMCIKLCRLFVHDNFPNPTTHADLPEYEFYNYTRPDLSPEAALVRQCMTAWDTPGPDNRRGNIYSVLRTIFNSELFRTNANMNKIKTPLEFAVSSIRATRMNTNAPAVNQAGFTSRTDGYAISGTGQSAAPTCPLTRMGNMLLFERDSPDGYPETAPPWISAGTLAERLRYVQSINIAPSQTGKSDAGANNITDPVGVIFAKLAGVDRQDAGKVADLFIRMIFPGEGPANLNQYRAAAVDFLNTNDSAASNAFSTLVPGRSNSANSYEVRVRGLVAMLMTFQRFQEQ